MLLMAGFMDERGDYPLHHHQAQFDEKNALCYWCGMFLKYCASHWLENHKNRT